MASLTVAACVALSKQISLVALRKRAGDLCLRKCRYPGLRRTTLPVAVILNFLAIDFLVFCICPISEYHPKIFVKLKTENFTKLMASNRNRENGKIKKRSEKALLLC